MSAPSSRRLRDRNPIAGDKTSTALKPTKTLSPNPNSATLKRSLSGKENTGSSARVQRPAIRSVPRVDKTATSMADGSVGKMRRSASAAPRGWSSSPSEFIKVLRDSRVSRGESDNRLVSSGGKRTGARIVRNCKESEKSGIKVLNSACNNLATGVNLDKLCGEKSGSSLEFDCLRECNEKSSTAKVLENTKENGLTEIVGNKVGVKYPSKLHEKLAFLEGKVKRIASDIKKTKEMLDMNNPEASRLILSDIQYKITGIEKTMVHDIDSRGLRVDGGDDKVVEKTESKKVEDSNKSLVIGLSSDELEARLFPHQKLLQNRASRKVSVGSCQNFHESDAIELGRELGVEQKILSPVEENPVAKEFLASLNMEDTKATVKDAMVNYASCGVEGTDGTAVSRKDDSSNMFSSNNEEELVLASDEKLDDFDDMENINPIIVDDDAENTCFYQLTEIGTKNATGGWFVSEGESVVLAHDDGSCSFYDIANCEEKTVYKPPVGVLPNIWRDCWIIRAASADGCSGRYVVAASAGNNLDSGFCSWDFYSKDVKAFHKEDGGSISSRTILGPLSNNATYRRNALSNTLLPETKKWWYKPCGPLMVSTASLQTVVKTFDIRDGEQILKWDLQKPVLAMQYSSPLQWRNRGKIVVVETEAISVWDVNSLNPQPLTCISLSGRKISALHVVNTDAELGGGVRQRVTSAEAEGNDGVFCTPDSINVLDLRNPSGIGLKIPKMGVNAHSVFTRGDSIYMGCTNMRSATKKQPCPQVQHYSLRKQRLVNTFSLPEADNHLQYSDITQVWGNSNHVMGVCSRGLFVYDALKDEGMQSFADCGSTQKLKDVIGPDDLYSPSFDYLASRVLLISRDRPALWRHLT